MSFCESGRTLRKRLSELQQLGTRLPLVRVSSISNCRGVLSLCQPPVSLVGPGVLHFESTSLILENDELTKGNYKDMTT